MGYANPYTSVQDCAHSIVKIRQKFAGLPTLRSTCPHIRFHLAVQLHSQAPIRVQLQENHMQSRTNKLIFHFNNTFSFGGSERVFPPGDYSILEDEELIEGNTWLAYRRKATFIQIPAIGTVETPPQKLEINHDELKAILDQDVQKGMNDAPRDQKSTGRKI